MVLGRVVAALWCCGFDFYSYICTYRSRSKTTPKPIHHNVFQRHRHDYKHTSHNKLYQKCHAEGAMCGRMDNPDVPLDVGGTRRNGAGPEGGLPLHVLPAALRARGRHRLGEIRQLDGTGTGRFHHLHLRCGHLEIRPADTQICGRARRPRPRPRDAATIHLQNPTSTTAGAH